MRIWCIEIGNVLVLHFNPWVEISAGGLLVSEGLFSPVAKYFLALKYEYELNCQEKSIFFYKFISKRRIISLRHSSILPRIWLNLMTLCFDFHPTALSQYFWISNFFDLSIAEET
jgi:hypothetical protein